MSFRVEHAFRVLLTESPTISALVGKRMYPNVAPQNRPTDSADTHIVYQIVDSVVGERFLDGPGTWTRTRVQLDCYSRNYDQARDLADAIRLVADGYSGQVTGADGSSLLLRTIRLDDTRDGYEFGSDEIGWHRASMDFIIWHPSSVPAFLGR